VSVTTQPGERKATQPRATGSPPEISLVMPCYNEEACLRNTARGLLQAFANRRIALELVLVDNGSRDRTGEIIDELIAEGLPVVKVAIPVNQGYGHGILEGLKRCSAPFIGYLCADGQVSAEDTVRVYTLVKDTDGRILVKVRRRFRKDGWKRKITSICYNGLMLLLFGRLQVIDINGSPKIFSRDAFRRMRLESKDWFLDPEIMIKAKHMGLTPLEMNVRGLLRQGGKSNVRSSTVLEFVKNILRYRCTGKISEWKRTLAQPAEEVAPDPLAASGATVPTAPREPQWSGLLGAVRVLEQARFEDARGYLQKILTAAQSGGEAPRGEVYVTCAHPGEAKGNHFHRKMGEWFAVVQGEASVELVDPETGRSRSVPLGVSRPRTVYVPAGLAHAVVNNSNAPIVCVAWAERDHDPDDVFPFTVWPRPA
jgi:dTDP-4-dehydrorhamnose 3,5-epimerase-like enzyme